MEDDSEELEQQQQSDPVEENATLRDKILILPGIILVVIVFFKFVLPALDQNANHSPTTVLEHSEENPYLDVFFK